MIVTGKWNEPGENQGNWYDGKVVPVNTKKNPSTLNSWMVTWILHCHGKMLLYPIKRRKSKVR